MSSVKKGKNTNSKPANNKNDNFKRKLMVVIGVIILGTIIVYLMNYFFVEKNYIKINMSTDKKMEYITINGEEELISTQKYVSDLGYNMRYDIHAFKVFKYKGQDIFRCLIDDRALLAIEKSSLPLTCSNETSQNGVSSCYLKIDNVTDEYYYYNEKNTYKVTIKKTSVKENIEKIEKSMSYMLNSLVLDN